MKDERPTVINPEYKILPQDAGGSITIFKNGKQTESQIKRLGYSPKHGFVYGISETGIKYTRKPLLDRNNTDKWEYFEIKEPVEMEPDRDPIPKMITAGNVPKEKIQISQSLEKPTLIKIKETIEVVDILQQLIEERLSELANQKKNTLSEDEAIKIWEKIKKEKYIRGITSSVMGQPFDVQYEFLEITDFAEIQKKGEKSDKNIQILLNGLYEYLSRKFVENYTEYKNKNPMFKIGETTKYLVEKYPDEIEVLNLELRMQKLEEARQKAYLYIRKLTEKIKKSDGDDNFLVTSTKKSNTIEYWLHGYESVTLLSDLPFKSFNDLKYSASKTVINATKLKEKNLTFFISQADTRNVDLSIEGIPSPESFLIEIECLEKFYTEISRLSKTDLSLPDSELRKKFEKLKPENHTPWKYYSRFGVTEEFAQFAKARENKVNLIYDTALKNYENFKEWENRIKKAIKVKVELDYVRQKIRSLKVLNGREFGKMEKIGGLLETKAALIQEIDKTINTKVGVMKGHIKNRAINLGAMNAEGDEVAFSQENLDLANVRNELIIYRQSKDSANSALVELAEKWPIFRREAKVKNLNTKIESANRQIADAERREKALMKKESEELQEVKNVLSYIDNPKYSELLNGYGREGLAVREHLEQLKIYAENKAKELSILDSNTKNILEVYKKLSEREDMLNNELKLFNSELEIVK